MLGFGAGLGIFTICSEHACRATARSSLRKLLVRNVRARPRQADVAPDVQGHAGAQRWTLNARPKCSSLHRGTVVLAFLT